LLDISNCVLVVSCYINRDFNISVLELGMTLSLEKRSLNDQNQSTVYIKKKCIHSPIVKSSFYHHMPTLWKEDLCLNLHTHMSWCK
jgi:hypothetical protein